MTKREMLAITGAAVLLGTAAATVTLRSALADESWKAVTLVYHSDVKGKIEPCG
jgi:hypothetical protein